MNVAKITNVNHMKNHFLTETMNIKGYIPILKIANLWKENKRRNEYVRIENKSLSKF